MKWQWVMQMFFGCFFLLFFFFLDFFSVSEGRRTILAYLLIMCLCEYFYFKSEINKISLLSNVTWCCGFNFLSWTSVSLITSIRFLVKITYKIYFKSLTFYNIYRVSGNDVIASSRLFDQLVTPSGYNTLLHPPLTTNVYIYMYLHTVIKALNQG